METPKVSEIIGILRGFLEGDGAFVQRSVVVDIKRREARLAEINGIARTLARYKINLQTNPQPAGRSLRQSRNSGLS